MIDICWWIDFYIKLLVWCPLCHSLACNSNRLLGPKSLLLLPDKLKHEGPSGDSYQLIFMGKVQCPHLFSYSLKQRLYFHWRLLCWFKVEPSATWFHYHNGTYTGPIWYQIRAALENGIFIEWCNIVESLWMSKPGCLKITIVELSTEDREKAK